MSWTHRSVHENQAEHPESVLLTRGWMLHAEEVFLHAVTATASGADGLHGEPLHHVSSVSPVATHQAEVGQTCQHEQISAAHIKSLQFNGIMWTKLRHPTHIVFSILSWSDFKTRLQNNQLSILLLPIQFIKVWSKWKWFLSNTSLYHFSKIKWM